MIWWMPASIWMILAFTIAAFLPADQKRRVTVLTDKLFYLFVAFGTSIIFWIVCGVLK